jgi:hypothetical protein
MIEITLAENRKAETLYSYHDEIVHIVDGRKKEIEKTQKCSLLERIAKAQASDPIEEGGIADGIN